MPSNSSSIDIANESMIIVFDADGRISDVHHFVTAKGGKHPTETEQEKAALESATRAGTDTKKASVLRMLPSAVGVNEVRAAVIVWLPALALIA